MKRVRMTPIVPADWENVEETDEKADIVIERAVATQVFLVRRLLKWKVYDDATRFCR